MLRSLTALLTLLAVTASSAETVIGVMRDGAVHHESMAEAVSHALVTHGDHGHEDGAKHGSEHQHGTQGDHCTHHHGAPLTPPPIVLIVVPYTTPSSFLELIPWLDRFTEPLSPPPQA